MNNYYAHKLDNLDKEYQLLKKHKLPKLIQEKIQNLDIPLTIEVKSVLKYFMERKCPSPSFLVFICCLYILFGQVSV